HKTGAWTEGSGSRGSNELKYRRNEKRPGGTPDPGFVPRTDVVEVVNKKGSVLPSAGGIVTTIFYIIGAILVIGAGVVLVTRRYMNVQLAFLEEKSRSVRHTKQNIKEK
ncbi:MAG: LPXTG cell wall anchor domain-containing protein, partial [Lachnospiraceae bacterium]|nr:LPXTG cell wall anchor domain-containing protein [Lachnospiraceae bacterium]